MEALPADIIEEILVRLPVKSLLRFKCACRRWCVLIQSRRFIHHHYTNEDRLIFRLREWVDYRLEDGHNVNVSHHLGAVNGILCEVSTSGDIVLLNPATHKLKRVDVPPPLPLGRRYPEYILTLGFGFESLSGDYKIVAIVDGTGEFVWVYNSSSDCWKRVEVVGSCSVIKAVRYSRCLNAGFSNGVYYWVVLVLDGGVRHYDILAFDMMSEKFREIKFPELKAQRGDGVAFIAAYGDSIAVMWRRYGQGCELWVMGKQGIWSKSWASKDYYWMWSTSLCLWENKVLFLNYQGGAHNLFDLSTQQVQRVEVEPPKQYPIKYPPFSYKESLFWIKE